MKNELTKMIMAMPTEKIKELTKELLQDLVEKNAIEWEEVKEVFEKAKDKDRPKLSDFPNIERTAEDIANDAKEDAEEVEHQRKYKATLYTPES